MDLLINFFDGDDVRIISNFRGLHLVFNDVCRALEYINPRDVIHKLNADERTTLKFLIEQGIEQGGGDLATTFYRVEGGLQPQTTLITESGAYRLIAKSKKKKAEKFKNWLFGEVLPSIRKTGGYVLEGTEAEMQARAQEAIEWQEARLTGKVTRRIETDNVRDLLIPMAKEQGSENPKQLYQVYSRLVNSTLGIKPKKHTRDKLPKEYLEAIRLMENIIQHTVRREVATNTYYKTIYRLCKADCIRLVSLLFLPELED